MSSTLKPSEVQHFQFDYKKVVLEEPHYHIWGCSPIWGDDGKVHLFASRIPVEATFDRWWVDCEIAHYRGDQPEGPYEFIEVLLQPGKSPQGSWDCGTQHNPNISKIDDLYVLSYHSNSSSPEKWARSSHSIGMLTAKNINGPWKKLGKILGAPIHDEVPIVPEYYDGPTDNPALTQAPNGKIHLYYRIKFPGLEGKNTYCLATADSIEGPYKRHPVRVVNNQDYIEDPYAFTMGKNIYFLITDNETGRGLMLSSEDGLSFDYSKGEKAYGPMTEYFDKETMNKATNYRCPKFERPQLLLKDGIPTHMFAPSGSNINAGPGTCCYLFEISSSSL